MISSDKKFVKLCLAKVWLMRFDRAYEEVRLKMASEGDPRFLSKQEFFRMMVMYGFQYLNKKYKLETSDDEIRIMPIQSADLIQEKPVKSLFLWGKTIAKKLDDSERALYNQAKRFSDADNFIFAMAKKGNYMTAKFILCDLVGWEKERFDNTYSRDLERIETHGHTTKNIIVDYSALIGD